jgi:hypothetical protein
MTTLWIALGVCAYAIVGLFVCRERRELNYLVVVFWPFVVLHRIAINAVYDKRCESTFLAKYRCIRESGHTGKHCNWEDVRWHDHEADKEPSK